MKRIPYILISCALVLLAIGLPKGESPAQSPNTLPPAIVVDGVRYVSTGRAMPAEIDPSAIIGTVSGMVHGSQQPTTEGEINFPAADAIYARVENGIAVQIGHEWVLFTPASAYVAPLAWKQIYSVASDIETAVYVDANVFVPDAETFPVYEVGYCPLYAQTVTAFADAVSGGKVMDLGVKRQVEFSYDEEQTGRIEVVSDEKARINRLSFSLEGKYRVLTLPANPYAEFRDGNTALTMAEARKTAEAFAAEICDYRLIAGGVRRCVTGSEDTAERTRMDAYTFAFAPAEENGAPRTYVDTAYLAGETAAAPQTPYRAARAQPSLCVTVNEQGILRAVWESANAEKLLKTVEQNAVLLPFDRVMKLFEETIGREGNFLLQNGAPPRARELYITEIRLGYMRTADGDAERLIPVWDFFGYETNTFSSQADTEWELEADNTSTRPALGHAYLTLNAVNGSVINRVLGY